MVAASPISPELMRAAPKVRDLTPQTQAFNQDVNRQVAATNNGMKVNAKTEPLTGITSSIVGDDRKALERNNASTQPGARVPTLTGATSAFVTEMKSSDQRNVDSMASAAARARTIGQGPQGGVLDLSA
ncbi:hypothetical protein N825_28420 [Skermanella stibiiresistens SB22]|uniref:Uncharacterized protein n=1 Tax=Skermanella stibiiresistens SB22 TaxID=1385369 RepID=W9H9V0_9PROT|nr:hypothetical protein [Skermanella stibiiresistens]EWY41531.1 hypothetical protein N825_28420 [Skermanella stibiiresistens SB22]